MGLGEKVQLAGAVDRFRAVGHIQLAVDRGNHPGNSEQIAGYEIYALDCTPNEREAAETQKASISIRGWCDW